VAFFVPSRAHGIRDGHAFRAVREVAVVRGGRGCTLGVILGLLDRHIFKNVLLTCIGAVGFFTFIMTAGNAMKDLIGHFLAGRMSLGTTVELLLLLLPYAVMYAMPMGILCGVLLVLGRMSAENEITAMRAAGLSLTRIARPIYVLGVLGMIAALFVNLQFMPQARVRYKQELLNALRTDPRLLIVPKTFIREFPQKVVFVDDRKGDELRNVWVWRLDKESRVTQLLRAESGTIMFDEERNGLVFTSRNAIVEGRSERLPEDFKNGVQYGGFKDTSSLFPLEKIFGQKSLQSKPEWYTVTELMNEIGKLSSPTSELDETTRIKQLTKLRMVLQDKLAMGVAVLTFVFVAVPLGIKVSRRETSANLGVAVLLALGYYFLTVVVKWLEGSPQIRPDVWLWLPNLIFVFLGVWLIRRVQRA
jgi:lipopolysaccharide export system permease protein